jgi:biotin carboxylase
MHSVVLCKWQSKLAAALFDRTDVHLVLDEFDVTHAGPDPDLLARAASVHVVSTFNALEELATVAVDIALTDPDVRTVLSYTEFSQLGAAYLADLLDGERGGHVATSVRSRDKRLMKSLVAAAGVRTARVRSISDPMDADQVAAVADTVTYPVVVKPASGFGGMSTHKVHDAAELRKLCLDFAYEPAIASRHLAVEEFITGEEFHVDAYWGAEDAEFCVVSRYFAPRLVVQRGEHSAGGVTLTDGSEVISPDDQPELHARISNFHRRVNAALGIRNTITHLELFRTPTGELVFSEIATRPGGGWVPALLTQALGRDLWAVMADCVLGGKADIRLAPASHLAAVHLRPACPGTIIETPTAEQVAEVPGTLDHRILRSVGTTIQLNYPSDWCGFIIVGAASREELLARAEDVNRRLRIVTDGVVSGAGA